MSRGLLGTLAASAVLIGIVLLLVVDTNQNNLLRLEGKIDNVQVEKLSDDAHLVILDFVIKNPSKKLFEVKSIEVEVGPTGHAIPGGILAKRELASYFEFKQIEPMDPVLGGGDVIKPGERVHRIVGARFEKDMEGLEDASYLVRIRDINDVTSDLTSKSK